MKFEFLGSGREPRCPPDPAFLKGKDIDASGGAALTCSVDIPYPAPRCGVMVVRCEKCRLRVGLTVAGRPDDPRSIKLACRGTQ